MRLRKSWTRCSKAATTVATVMTQTIVAQTTKLKYLINEFNFYYNKIILKLIDKS